MEFFYASHIISANVLTWLTLMMLTQTSTQSTTRELAINALLWNLTRNVQFWVLPVHSQECRHCWRHSLIFILAMKGVIQKQCYDTTTSFSCTLDGSSQWIICLHLAPSLPVSHQPSFTISTNLFFSCLAEVLTSNPVHPSHSHWKP